MSNVNPPYKFPKPYGRSENIIYASLVGKGLIAQDGVAREKPWEAWVRGLVMPSNASHHNLLHDFQVALGGSNMERCGSSWGYDRI